MNMNESHCTYEIAKGRGKKKTNLKSSLFSFQTYTVDAQVTDSAAAATALFSGVKTNYKLVGFDSRQGPDSMGNKIGLQNGANFFLQFNEFRASGWIGANLRQFCG